MLYSVCFRNNFFLQKRRLHTGSFQHHNSLLTKMRGWSRKCKKQVLQTIPHISLHITKHIQKSPKYPGLVPKLLLHCKRTVYPGTRVTVLLWHLGTTKCLCVKSGGSSYYSLCLKLLTLHLSSACTTWKCSYICPVSQKLYFSSSLSSHPFIHLPTTCTSYFQMKSISNKSSNRFIVPYSLLL